MKVWCGFLSPLKIHRLGWVLNPQPLGPVASTLTNTPPLLISASPFISLTQKLKYIRGYLVCCFTYSATHANSHSMAPDPKGSSPYLQEPDTGTYPQPTGITLHPPANLPKIKSDQILPSMPWSLKWSLSFWFSHQNLIHIAWLSHVCHMQMSSQSPWFDLPNNILGWVQYMNLLIVNLLHTCYFIPPLSKYSL
jgi:hypothetical protein